MKLYVFQAEEPPETCRISCQSKFGKLVHLVGFIRKKFVTMHSHMNKKYHPHICDLILGNEKSHGAKGGRPQLCL
jgi:hypothetical protein